MRNKILFLYKQMNRTVEWLIHYSNGLLSAFITAEFSDVHEDVSAMRVYADIRNTLEELWRSDLMSELDNACDELHFNYMEQWSEYEE